MANDKKKLFLMGLLTVTLFIGIALYAYMSVRLNELNLGNIVSFIIPVILVVFMVFFILRRYRDIKVGMPLEDERSKKVMTRAAAMSFYVTLYWLLAISWFEPFFARVAGLENLTASQTTGGGIAGMALFFCAFWLYYDKKGDLV